MSIQTAQPLLFDFFGVPIVVELRDSLGKKGRAVVRDAAGQPAHSGVLLPDKPEAPARGVISPVCARPAGKGPLFPLVCLTACSKDRHPR